MSWVMVLIPLWILNVVVLGIIAVSMGNAWFAFLKITSIFVLEILLALRWDGTIDFDYAMVFLPLYIYHVFVAIENIVIIRNMTRDISRMITLEYLEYSILPNLR